MMGDGDHDDDDGNKEAKCRVSCDVCRVVSCSTPDSLSLFYSTSDPTVGVKERE